MRLAGTGTWEDEGKERRVVTVLFADMSGFTALAEGLDPEEVEERIRACWARLTPVIERHGGYVDKYIGDAVMALFGAPLAHEDDPERAVRCALALHNALRDDRLRLRIGVHTGEVIVGSVSSRGEKDYTAMGDTVNTASRLHTHTAPGRTLISQATRRLVEGLFVVQDLEAVKVKGKTEAIRACEVIGPAPRVRAGDGPATGFVGREAELGRMSAAFEKARTSKGFTALAVSGSPGIGKARIVAEWRRRTRVKYPEAIFLEGGAVPYGGEPCRPVREAVLTRYGDEADPAERLRALAEDLSATDKSPEQAAGFIAQLFGLEIGTRTRHLDPRDLRVAAFAALESLFRALTARGPLVLALHELQWVDSATLDFIEHLAKSAPPAPILLLAIGRTEAFRDHRVLADLERVELPPLSPDDTRVLASSLLGGREVPPELDDLLHRRTEGNAFFIEETLRALVEEGALVDDADMDIDGAEITLRPARAVRLTRPIDQILIPHTVQGVITSRIDSLPEEARKVLKAAAVAGRVFSRSLLERVLGRPVDADLREIARRDMIHERPGVEDREYAFAHPLIAEVAYREILRRNRKTLHRGIAQALEERLLAGRRTLDLLVSAADHFEKADVRDRAVSLFLEAAERAHQVFSLQESHACYSRVLAMEERTEALQGRAEVSRHIGKPLEALNDFRRLKEIREREGDDVRRREAENGMAHTLAYMERYAEAEKEARRIVEEATAGGDAAAEALALNTLGFVCLRLQKDEEAIAAWSRSETVARNTGDRKAAARAINNLGLLSLRRRRFEEARRAFEDSIALDREAGNRAGVVGSLTNLAEAHSRLGDTARAIETCQEAIRLAREIGLRYALGVCLNNLANIHASSHRYGEALELYNEAMALRREMGDRIGVATTLANTAIVRWLLGDFGGARTSLDRALDLARAIRQPRVVSTVLQTRGNLFRMLGDFESARRDHREMGAVEPARDVEARLEVAHDLIEEGKTADALALLREAPPAAAAPLLAAAGEPGSAARLLAAPPPPDQTALIWSAAAVAARHAPSADALARLASDLESRGLAGISWRIRADRAALTATPEDASLALRQADRAGQSLPENERKAFFNHPALRRLRAPEAP